MSGEDDWYDEFGNYIGPELDDNSDEDDDSDEEDNDIDENSSLDENPDARSDSIIENEVTMTDLVLHEDKVHYPSASEVYGDDVRTAVLDEDATELHIPLVEPIKTQTTILQARNDWIYRDDYMTALFGNDSSRMRRGMALVGHLHCGKTTFLDMILERTMKQPWGPTASLNAQDGGGPRYCDTLPSEQQRQMSLVSTPITTILPDTRGKSYLLTIIDCPGHVHFHDESVAALRAVDGALIMLDAVEGIMMHTEMVVKQAISEGIPITMIINKVDRLIIELKLPPRDTYYKLLHLVESMNDLIATASNGTYPQLSPSKNNVVFASAQHGWCFTLKSFAQLYQEQLCEHGLGGDHIPDTDLSLRLWGDAYWDPTTRTFHQSSRSCSMAGVERTFCTLVLGPIYKLYTACLAEHPHQVHQLLRHVGVRLSKDQLRSSARPLLRSACYQFFATATAGFVDMVVQYIPSPAVAAKAKVARCYNGPLDSPVAQNMSTCDGATPTTTLMIHCVKLYASHHNDGQQQSFSVLGRIYAGTVAPGDRVKVLGEGFSPDEDDEDMAMATVTSVSIPRGRSTLKVTRATAGNWVLLEGVDATISKTATLTSVGDETVHIFAPLTFPHAGGESTMQLALEPLNPAELPKMVESLRRISKAYPMAKTRVEESGEHVLFGTGELYMDCMMHDLRNVYSDIEVKVADPVVGFRETVVETSSLKCFAETTNKRNKLTFIAEPLDDGLADVLEAGKINLDWDKKKMGRFFQTKYDWDLLSSRSIWAFGSSPTHGTNILMDDTLPSEVDKLLLGSCKSSIVQGFQWATREGPLCEEAIRGTKLKILDALLADAPIHRGGGQMIPTARRTVHSAVLTATPRLMEPVYRLQIQCPGEIVDAIQPLLNRRRGHIVQDKPIAGSTMYSVKAFLPVLDSFGFETDLRTFTQGQAMVHSVFDHWAVVPGDPLDKNIILHPLEPSPPHSLARELLIKTRRRKGLSEDVSINKFFDEGMKLQLAHDEADVLMQ